ncbi:MAG: hypothetical protein KGP28_05695 [Bdellovibrionales bacterium]|nr:hypothetical protein [Bdellovibrionales bacterium]
MKPRLPLRVYLLVSVLFCFGLVAFATMNQDPLQAKYQEVHDLVFGVENKLALFPGPDERTGGLFAKDVDGEAIIVPLYNNQSYDQALNQVRSLKEMIEKEMVRRNSLPVGSSKFQTLLEIISKYTEFQKGFHFNYLSNLHENQAALGAFRVDELNLKLNSRVGYRLYIQGELLQKYNIRHLNSEQDPDAVELFLPVYERASLEVKALARAKTKIEYQKLIHFSHLRDSLVNRWALSRITHGGIPEGVSLPPRAYDTFAGDQADRPMNFQFSRDLGVEDRYETRIQKPLQKLQEALSEMPLASEEEFRKLVIDFYGSFSQFNGYQINPDSVISNLYDHGERGLSDVAGQLIKQSNFPQDDLSPAAIARRIAYSAFLVRKAGILETLLQRLNSDLSVFLGYVNPDENGFISEEALLSAPKYLQIPKNDLVRAEKVVDTFLGKVEEDWRKRMAEKIETLYLKQHGILEEESGVAHERLGAFFNNTMKTAAKSFFHFGQGKRYEELKKKLDAVTSDVAGSLDSTRVPLDLQCTASPSFAMAVMSSCITKLKSDLYLAGLDAGADAGMEWTIPWTVHQIYGLFSAKLGFLKDHEPEKWKLVEAYSQDPVLTYFFGKLGELQQEATVVRKMEYQQKKLEFSEKLATLILKYPEIRIHETEEYLEMQRLQEKIDSVGIESHESVLTAEMYEEAAIYALRKRNHELNTPPPPAAGLEEEPPAKKFEIVNDDSPEFPKPRLLTFTQKADTDQTQVAQRRELQKQMEAQYQNRRDAAGGIALLFSLLGFSVDFISEHCAKIPPFAMDLIRTRGDRFEARFPKPDANTIRGLGGMFPNTIREERGSALSEMARSAYSQKVLSEIAIQGIYAVAPFLRIREGDDEKAPTGLERIYEIYSKSAVWNESNAHTTFESLVQTAIRNDKGKVEDAIIANPMLPKQDEHFKRTFRSQIGQRSIFLASLFGEKRDRVSRWEEDLKLETRTQAEVWNDRFCLAAEVLFYISMVILAVQIAGPVLLAFAGFGVPAAGSAGLVGSLIFGILKGSNFFVQLFFLGTIATNGNVAFFVLPAQLKYEREIANSTVGLSGNSARILLPSERVSQEQLIQMGEQIQQSKLMTGFGAALQAAFLPFQVKNFLRWSGASGKTALKKLGASRPDVVKSMEQYSLKDLVNRHGYAKGGRMYFERYRSAMAENKVVSSVNGGAMVTDAQILLAESMSKKLPDSAVLLSIFDRRIAAISEEVAALNEKAIRYFSITQGGKAKNMEEAIRIFFGKELGKINFLMQKPSFRIGIERSFFNSVMRGEVPEIAEGTGKHLLKSFLLKTQADNLVQESLYLQRLSAEIRSLEASAGDALNTQVIFLDMSRIPNFGTLDNLLAWGSSLPEYEASELANLLREAKEISNNFKVVVDDINRLTPRELEIYWAMQGKVDVIVNENLTLSKGTGQPGVGDSEVLIVPGSSILPQ